MTEPFRTTRRVEFVDTDMAGIVHFSNFFRWMESAEAELLRARGVTFKLRWEGQELGFPRVSAACDYRKPARFQDLLTIQVLVEKIGRKSVSYRFEFSNQAGDPLATGRITAVYCRTNSPDQIEALDIPDDIRAKLQGAM